MQVTDRSRFKTSNRARQVRSIIFLAFDLRSRYSSCRARAALSFPAGSEWARLHCAVLCVQRKGSEGKMDRYQRVEKPREEAPIKENEIRITTQGRMRNYITYATALLQVCLLARSLFHRGL